MKVLRTPVEMHSLRDEFRGRTGTVGLVPTMGYLHEGHNSLLRTARAENDVVVMSLFVNPTQFRAGEDLSTYPRDEERDLAIAEGSGVDFVYAPLPDDIYPAGFSTKVVVEGLTEVLCGSETSRGPGHFAGVTTIVSKLLNAVDPDVAYIGELFLHPRFQGAGLGREICLRLGQVLRPGPAKTLRVGVGLRNWNALRFWVKLGFTHVTGMSGDRHFSPHGHAFLELEKNL